MHFSETQRFNKWWHWIIFTGIVILLIAVIVQTFKLSDGNQLGVFNGVIVLTLIAVLWLGMRLKTRIDKEGIHYQYLPFHWRERHIPWSEIEEISIQHYSPLGDYGGWGLRFRFFDFSDVLLNVSGNYGIRVVRKNGSKRMIGSLKWENAQEAIEALRPRH